MSALVANYGSDSSENEDDSCSKDGDYKVIKDRPTNLTEKKQINYFAANESESEESNSEKEDEKVTTVKESRLPNPLQEPLPSASSLLGYQPGSSVFVSQYHIAEKEKESILEQHVKLSATKIPTGKKVQFCHKFKKGRCRMGKGCKYSHDIESQSVPDQSSDKNEAFGQVIDPRTGANSIPLYHDRRRSFNKNEAFGQVTDPRTGANSIPLYHDRRRSSNKNEAFGQVTDPRTGANSIPLYHDRVRKQLPQTQYIPAPEKFDDRDDDSYLSNMKRKKRAGLAGTLVPSKKAMSSLEKQRQTERPWTMDRQ